MLFATPNAFAIASKRGLLLIARMKRLSFTFLCCRSEGSGATSINPLSSSPFGPIVTVSALWIRSATFLANRCNSTRSTRTMLSVVIGHMITRSSSMIQILYDVILFILAVMPLRPLIFRRRLPCPRRVVSHLPADRPR